MIIAKTSAAAALLAGLIGVASVSGAAAGTNPKTQPHPTIFVTNSQYLTAYPANSRGDVAPIALTTDMTAPGGIARDASGRIYVTNTSTSTVTIYAANANGNVPPIAVIGGPNTSLANPTAIALDASGKIYVLNSGEYPKGIAVYPPLGTSSGILDEAPVAAIAGAKTLLDDPAAIAVDPSGTIYVANELGGPVVRGEPLDHGRLTVYAAGSKGNVAPIVTITGARTGLAYPLGIVLDSDDNIYVTNTETANTGDDAQYNASITIYPAGSTGDAQPVAIITGNDTDLDYPRAIALDSSRNIYVTGYVNGLANAIDIYPAGSDGDVSPAAIIAGADTGLTDAAAIALDSGGSLFVLNVYGGPANGGSITVYPDGSGGDTVPTTTITSSFTGLESASGIAVDSSGKIYVAHESGGADGDGSIAIYSLGSYATSPPIATIAGDNTGLSNPFGIGVDSNGNISVLNSDKAITVYPAGSAGDATPNSTINVDSRGNGFPTGMAVGPHGKLYVANQGTVKCNSQQFCHQTSPGSVAAYPAVSDGNAGPSAVIAGPDTNLASPSAIAMDHNGEIYVANKGWARCPRYCGCYLPGPGSVTVYAAGSEGNAKPIATISGANTELQFALRNQRRFKRKHLCVEWRGLRLFL